MLPVTALYAVVFCGLVAGISTAYTLENQHAEAVRAVLKRGTLATRVEVPCRMNKTQLLQQLAEIRVPFPELWLKVAVTETGHDFRAGVGAINNPFAMRCHNRPTQCGCTAHGYAVYESHQHAVHDIKLWSELDPPTEGEDGIAWLKRRGYNPYPAYYQYVAALEPFIGPAG